VSEEEKGSQGQGSGSGNRETESKWFQAPDNPLEKKKKIVWNHKAPNKQDVLSNPLMMRQGVPMTCIPSDPDPDP